MIPFDRDWFKSVLEKYVVTFRDTHNVPIFLNQFAVHYEVSELNGRYEYVRDLISVLHELDIGYAWWTFRGTGNGYRGPNTGWSNSSSDVVWFRDSDNQSGVDTEILNAMREGNEFVVQDRAVEDRTVNTTSGLIQGIELEGSKYVRKAYLGVPYVLFSKRHILTYYFTRKHSDTLNLQNVGRKQSRLCARTVCSSQMRPGKIAGATLYPERTLHTCRSLV